MDKHYVGSFEIDDRQFEGEIIHNAQTGIIRLVVTFELSSSVGFRIKRSKNPKVIIGRLNNGNVVNLYNNELIENITQNFQYQKLVYSVKYMIWSYRKLPLPQFNILICEIENGLLWSGLTAIDTEELTSIHIKDITPKTFIWYNAKITFSTVLRSNLIGSLRKETCEIVEHLLITIETEEKKDVAFFTYIRDKILAMISFAIKDNINILKQYFLCNDDFTFENERKNYVKHFMFDDNPKYKIQENHPAEYNFKLNNLPEDDAEIPQKLEKLAPIFNLYLSLFKYPHMPFEMVFLNIVQALETLHSRFFYNNDKKKYINYVKERFDEGSLQYKLLLSATQIDPNCGYIILLSRLNDLLIRGKKDIFVRFYKDDLDFVQRIVDTRHYYTHYGENKRNKALKGDNLLDSICILSIILEYYVCDILGIDVSDQVANDLRHLVPDEHD